MAGGGDDPIITVRRQWNDWRQARYRLSDLSDFQMDDTSGGVWAVAPRPFLHAFVWCNRMIDGELAHSCNHGPPPHRIKICIVKKDNTKEIYAVARARLKQ